MKTGLFGPREFIYHEQEQGEARRDRSSDSTVVVETGAPKKSRSWIENSARLVPSERTTRRPHKWSRMKFPPRSSAVSDKIDVEHSSTRLSVSGVRDRNDLTYQASEIRFSTESKNRYKHSIMHTNYLQVQSWKKMTSIKQSAIKSQYQQSNGKGERIHSRISGEEIILINI